MVRVPISFPVTALDRFAMVTAEQNEYLTRVGPGTPMGTLFRRYWLPVLLAEELPEPDCAPVRVKLLGERLLAFRDTQPEGSGSSRSSARTAASACGSGATRRTVSAAPTTGGSTT